MLSYQNELPRNNNNIYIYIFSMKVCCLAYSARNKVTDIDQLKMLVLCSRHDHKLCKFLLSNKISGYFCSGIRIN